MAKEVPYSLLAKYFSGNCSEGENLQVEQWKAEEPGNGEIFEQYREIWNNSKTGGYRFAPDTDEALRSVNLKLGYEGESIPGSGNVTRLLYYTKRIAAVFILTAGLWMVYHTLHRKPATQALVEVATLQGEKKDVVLPDGSHVWLNAHSKLSYEAKFAGKERKVNLEGEAYFEVAKNPARPFIINAGNSVTTVLGTAFNLRARKGESAVIVTITEGKVAFAGKDMANPVKLLPGDMGILDRDKNKVERAANEDPNFMAWKTGKLIFKKAPLRQVAVTLTDFYGRNIEVIDGKADIPFTSTFDHQSLQDVITIMEMSLGLKADTTAHAIILK